MPDRSAILSSTIQFRSPDPPCPGSLGTHPRFRSSAPPWHLSLNGVHTAIERRLMGRNTTVQCLARQTGPHLLSDWWSVGLTRTHKWDQWCLPFSVCWDCQALSWSSARSNLWKRRSSLHKHGNDGVNSAHTIQTKLIITYHLYQLFRR